MDDILSEEMGFCAIQLKGQGNDDWEGVKRYIAYQLVISDYYPLTCTPFIRVQVGIVNYLLKSIIEFPPRYTEEPRKFASVMAISPFLCGLFAYCCPIHNNCALCIEWILLLSVICFLYSCRFLHFID